MRFLTRSLLAASMFALSACPGPTMSPDAGELEADAGFDAGDHPVDAGHAPSGLVTIPEQLAFGQVGMIPETRLSVTRKLALMHAGTDADLVIERWQVSGDEVRVTGPTLPVRLEPVAGANVVEIEVTLTPTSFGVKNWELKIFTDDPERPEHIVDLSANVVPTPDCRFSAPERLDISFGTISPPEHRDLMVRITNEGTSAIERCRFTGIQFAPESGPGFSLLDGPVIEERVLEPGESMDISVRISAVPGISGALEFDVNSAQTPHVRIPITVQQLATPDCITIAPEQLDYGDVALGCSSATRTVTVYNTCSSDVLLHGFSIAAGAGQPAGGPNCVGTAPCPEFHMVQSPAIPGTGLPLASGAAPAIFQVKYRPIDLGPDNGSVEVQWSTAGGELRAKAVTFNGSGVDVHPWTDTYIREAPPRLDVLFVLDDSPSMANQQASVAANLDAYLQSLELTPIDFHLGVISAAPAATPVMRSGASHPDQVLGRNSPDLRAQFAAKIDVGTSGSGSPSCLEQAVSALTPPLSTGANAGFLRADAELIVVCITDSTDHSPLPVTDYVSAMKALKANPSMVAFNAVAGFTPSCPGDLGRLADATTLTGGLQADLCSTNWSPADLPLGWGFPPPGFPGFFLSRAPDLSRGPLEVKVAGQVVPPTDASGATVWFYESLNNSVFFTAGHEPQFGQLVEITYFASCW